MQPYRQIELLEALASGEKRSSIVARFSKRWNIAPQSVYDAISRVLIRKPVLPELWKPTKPDVIERLRVLDEALKSGMSRGEIHERYREAWGISEVWLDQLLRRVRSRSRDHFDRAFEQARLQLKRHLQAKLAEAKEARSWERVLKILDEIYELFPDEPRNQS